MSTGPDAGASSLLAAFVEKLVDAEQRRRESLEARGRGVIAVSGTLVTLLLGIAAIVTGSATFVASAAVRDRLGWAAALFAGSTLLAVVTFVPHPARVTDPAEIARQLPGFWDESADFALKKTTATRLEQLQVVQDVNDRNAWELLSAVVLQAVALILLVWAVVTRFSEIPRCLHTAVSPRDWWSERQVTQL